MRIKNSIILVTGFAAALFIAACQGSENLVQTETAAKPKPIPTQSVAKFEGQPNIIIMVADDLGYADLGFRGSDIETPNIDRLAAEGVSLERFYVQPICTPTRSALMTGRDPMKLGSIYAGFQPWQNGGVSPEEHFMPESFKAAGYQTAMIGKWHLGHTIEPLTPNARGFDHFVGHLNTQIDYYDYTVANGYDLQENGQSIRREGVYATNMHTNETVRYLTDIRNPEKPFFLYVPFLAPHSPMQAPKDLEAKYSRRLNKPFPKKTYAAMVDSLDQGVGRILETLDAQGLRENTIVIFFSDNGGLEVFGADNGPWRGGKLETFEGGIRVNALLRWPGHIPAGQKIGDIVSVLDLFPTLTSAANIPMQAAKKIEGQDRWATLSGGISEKRNGDLYFASNSPMFNKYHVSVLEARWKLVQIIDHKPDKTEVENFLFDMIVDPQEKNNLVKVKPDEIKRLAKKIRNWRSQHPINGLRVALAPHPGWRAPKDYAISIVPADELQENYLDSYTSGLRGKILQQRHGDKGRLTYE